MPWYGNGLQGRDGSLYLNSDGIVEISPGFYSLNGGQIIGSVAITEQDEHNSLLLTVPSGTQIYLKVKRTTGSAQVYNPTETVTVAGYNSSIMIKKGDSSLEFTSGYSFAGVIAGENNIYDYQCRTEPGGGWVDGKCTSPDFAFPRTGRSGGGTQQIAMTTDSYGLHFWKVAFPCTTVSDTYYPAFIREVGRIPASALNNPFWFDQGSDGVTDAQKASMQGVGGIPGGDRPVDYTYAGTDVDFPGLPTGASALGFGVMSIFHPTASQLASALEIIWSMVDLSSLTDLFDTIRDVVVKLIYKPEQYCVSLMVMPLNISGTSKKILFGKYDTGVTAPAIADQWQVVDCGSVTVPLKSGSAFDFSPYVKAMIFLPYVGFRAINANEIMGGTIYVKYYVDMFTGSALCFVKIANSNSNTSVLYTYECNVAQQIPITASIYGNLIGTLIQASTAVITGNAGAVASAVGSGINNLAPDVQVSGQLNANTGALGNEKPYVALHFPVQNLPNGFIDQNGYPSNVNVRLSTLSGYTEVEKIHLSVPGASMDDLKEIEQKLSEGVIL